MTPDEAKERVTKGAALLDEMQPGWAERINVERLHINSCVRCVLGQVFQGSSERGDDFTAGLIALQLDGFEVWRHGFGIFAGKGLDADTPHTWNLLRECWIDAITERLTPPVQWTMRDTVATTGVGTRA